MKSSLLTLYYLLANTGLLLNISYLLDTRVNLKRMLAATIVELLAARDQSTISSEPPDSRTQKGRAASSTSSVSSRLRFGLRTVLGKV